MRVKLPTAPRKPASDMTKAARGSERSANSERAVKATAVSRVLSLPFWVTIAKMTKVRTGAKTWVV